MESIDQFLGLAGVPVIAALLQVVKPFITDDRYYPPAAIILGLAVNVGIAATQTNTDWALAVLLGIVTGLAASGLYSQAKTYVQS